MAADAETLDLVALICSRLCHDLAGAVGAVNNGIELLTEETDPVMRDEAIGLIAQSSSDAARRLAFFRHALGASGSMDEPMALADLARVAQAYFAGGKVAVSLPAEAGEIAKPLGKALLLLLALATQALARGGDLALTRDGSGWRIAGRGPMLRWPEPVTAALAGGDWPREPQAALARYALRLASLAGCRVAVQTGETEIALVLSA